MIIEAKIVNEKKVATLHFAIYFKNICVSSWIWILTNGADKNGVFLWSSKNYYESNQTLSMLCFKLLMFLQHHKHDILLSVLLTDILAAFSLLKMLWCSYKTICNNVIL